MRFLPGYLTPGFKAPGASPNLNGRVTHGGHMWLAPSMLDLGGKVNAKRVGQPATDLDGKHGLVWDFDGQSPANHRIDLEHPIQFERMTIIVGLKLTSSIGFVANYFGNDDTSPDSGFSLRSSSSTYSISYRHGGTSSTISSLSAPVVGQQEIISATLSPEGVSLYRNGVFQNSDTDPFTPTEKTNSINGLWNTNTPPSSFGWLGHIYFVEIIPWVLNATELLRHAVEPYRNIEPIRPLINYAAQPAVVASDSTLQWNLLEAVNADSTLQWNVGSQATSDSTLQWNILAFINSDSTLQWNLLETTNADSTLQWNVETGVNSDSTLQWNISAVVNNSSTLQWNISALVNSDSTLQWDVSTGISSDSTLQWDILEAVNGSSTLQWNILESVNSDSTLQWNVNSSVNGDSTLQWTVTGVVFVAAEGEQLMTTISENRIMRVL